MNGKYKGLEIEAPIRCVDGAILVEWSCPELGFGELTLYWDENDRLCADTEHMRRGFLRELLTKLADQIDVD